uniref:EpxB n=1 Tax=Goodfellowiella coeruleoviolacea TaxID=334858 RepID=V5RN11_9PSEU|nr:EpxB [Goodfellowiella coeruleoviolacea]
MNAESRTPQHSRRSLLRNTALMSAGLVAAQGIHSPASAVAAEAECPPPLGPVTVSPEDNRYQELVRRGHKRFVGSPDYVRVVGSTDQVVTAVQEAVRAGKRVAARSGGHCLEDFVDNPDVRVVIDLSGMTQVYFDPERNAFAVEAGAILEEVYRRLFLGWGVTLPAGWCPRVGAGGHVAGGGYGVLSRAHGLVVDYLHAVEVVVVDQSGQAKAVVATSDPADPLHELWWAHTGGGGGNFGIVTRYWFRSPKATGTDPSSLLPTAPSMVLDFSCQWPWEGMDEQRFAQLARNHARWCERNSSPDLPTARFYGELILMRRVAGGHVLLGQSSGPDAEQLLDDYLAEVSEGVGPAQNVVKQWRPWLTAVYAGPNTSKLYRLKIKSGYLRQGFSDSQLSAIYQQLTQAGNDSLVTGSLGLSTYGGAINTVASDATATATRDAVIKLLYSAAWDDPANDEENIAWLREFYQRVYAETGGVPDPADGAYINYPDNDLADPEVNTSGVPWHTLYYKDNYPRLQRVKSRWDPLNIFHHALSIEPA